MRRHTATICCTISSWCAVTLCCRMSQHIAAWHNMSWHIATLTTMYWDMQQAECDDILRRYVAHAAYRRGMPSHSACCMSQYIAAWHSMSWHIATHQSTSLHIMAHRSTSSRASAYHSTTSHTCTHTASPPHYARTPHYTPHYTPRLITHQHTPLTTLILLSPVSQYYSHPSAIRDGGK